MNFGRLAVENAEGIVLAHAVEVAPGKLLKKGHVLTKADIDSIKNNGIQTILGARIDETDMSEDTAAATVAAPLAGANVTVKPPFTGRANLFATKRGIAVVNEAQIKTLNHIDETITIATVKGYELVEANQMLATVKIIPFAAPKDKVEKVLSCMENAAQPIVSIHPFVKKKIGVISTMLPNTKEKVIAKSERIMADRLERCDNQIDVSRRCDHHETALAEAISALDKEGCDFILIFGASAITDRNDVIPAALKQVGGEIDHFGMPVDPGNLLLLGHLREKLVIGLPGCTRSPKLNGFDFVLDRLLADIPVTASDIMDMGAGGLLKEIPSRPQPRNQERKTTAAQGKSVAVLILAAGQSRRMGRKNKLLAEIDGKAMLSHTAETALKSKAAGVFGVTGHEKQQVEALFNELGITSFHNPDYAQGLSSSLKTGFRALADDFDGVLICLGDMPLVSTSLFNALIDAFDLEEGRAIIVPTFQGKRGNPVLIGSQYKSDILTLTGDIGAKALIAENESHVFNVEADKDSIFTDIDTPEALIALQQA
ncbi:molybdopterin-binding/glycosyltransferase family 2 protein [uncultured Sneathiella sp.]|uniref:molybdopterin-binding/glycosyltransferase family 2 protein n=1 Tax=uncultured Sneathiella sp. TaxID=879315 RepID=UPI002597CB1B|nr:molybdopterin-binding/glycosyltransferase family 2 protein [uncultured Sneathiella sp.]